MSNPLTDLVAFLTADTGDYLALGAARFVVVLVFYLLVVVSVILLVVNVRDERAQRTPRNLWIWLTRVLVGGMWFQGMLWKLPFGENNGLHYWTEQMAGRAAFPALGHFVADTLLPNFSLFNPLVFLAEFAFATSLILGLFVRIAGLGAMAMTLTLWLGIYNKRPGDPDEWSWSYIFLAMLIGYFVMLAAGRALGADAWLRRTVPSVRDNRGLGRLLRLLT